NGAVVLEARGKATNTEPSKLVRLNKGTNAFKLHFVSPSEGDAFVRLYWSGKEFPPEPIALGALSHEVTPELEKANQLRFGRDFVAQRPERNRFRRKFF